MVRKPALVFLQAVYLEPKSFTIKRIHSSFFKQLVISKQNKVKNKCPKISMIAFFSKVREEEPDKKLVKPLALKNCSIYIFFTDFGSFSLLLTNIERMRKKHAQTDFQNTNPKDKNLSSSSLCQNVVSNSSLDFTNHLQF